MYFFCSRPKKKKKLNFLVCTCTIQYIYQMRPPAPHNYLQICTYLMYVASNGKENIPNVSIGGGTKLKNGMGGVCGALLQSGSPVVFGMYV